MRLSTIREQEWREKNGYAFKTSFNNFLISKLKFHMIFRGMPILLCSFHSTFCFTRFPRLTAVISFSTGGYFSMQTNQIFVNTGNSRCLKCRCFTILDCSWSTLGPQKIYIKCITISSKYYIFSCFIAHGHQNSTNLAGWGLCQLQFSPLNIRGGIILPFLMGLDFKILRFHSFWKVFRGPAFVWNDRRGSLFEFPCFLKILSAKTMS